MLLTISEMEIFSQTVQDADALRAEIAQATTLKTVDYERAVGGRRYGGDTVGRIVVLTEEKRGELARLMRYIEENRPAVEETISSAVAGMRGSAAVKIELALKMHYLSGREWIEIGALFKTDAAKLRAEALTTMEGNG